MRSDLLYRFVNAMDKGELVAFRASEHLSVGKWQLQRQQLLDTLLSMDSYTPEALADSVSDPDYLRHLPIEKTRLYEAALAVVQQQRLKRSSNKDPMQLLQESVLLLDMGLTEEAVQKAMMGIAEAEKVEDVFAELQLREQLRMCLKQLPRAKNLEQITENEYRLETVVIKVANLSRYAIICDQLDDHTKRFRVANDDSVKAAMRSLMEEGQMSSMSKAISLPAQIRFASAHALYAESQGLLSESVRYWDLCLSLWESNPHRMAYRSHFYRQTIGNLIGLLIRSGQSQRVPALLKKMEQVPVSGRQASVYAFCELELTYQFYYMNNGQLQEALEREQPVRSGLKQFRKQMIESKELTLLFNFAIIHLVLGRNAQAKDYFSLIRNKGILHARLDLQGLARLFRLLLLLEDDHNDQFHYFLRSYKRTFRKDMPFYRLEDVVFKWLSKHKRDFHDAQRPARLMKLYNDLQEFEDRRMVGAEELRLWALSRAQGKSMMDLLLSKQKG